MKNKPYQIVWNNLQDRNDLIIELINKHTEEMLKEPGAKDRCRKYLEELGRDCGYWYDNEGNIHYDYEGQRDISDN